MSYWEAVIFGLVQGITEFLPISSTAHIVITELILGWDFPGLHFEIWLHLASVLAVILYFRRDLMEVIKGTIQFIIKPSPNTREYFFFSLYLVIATIITGGLGLLLKGLALDAMKTPPFIAAALLVTGILLIFIERFHHYGRREAREMKISDAVIVGLGQTLAVLPGISRAGITLVTALWVGLSRETAVRFSFLLSIPVILGSSVLLFGELDNSIWVQTDAGPLLVAFGAAFFFSFIGIYWLIDFLKKSKLIYFAFYCFLLAAFVFFFLEPGATF